MNIDYLRNFVKIIEEQTISSAARSLLIAQPALSNQLKSLESIYGAALLERGPRNVKLTDAGRILYERAKTILALEDQIQKEIDSCVRGHKGTLRLGTSAAPERTIERLLLNFQKENPEINYEIYETHAEKLVELLNNGIIEIAILRMHGNAYPELEPIVSTNEQLMAIYRRGFGWLDDDAPRIPLSALKDVPLSMSQGMLHIVTDACMEEGFAPTVLSVSTSRTTAYMWCTKGAAVTILPVFDAADYENDKLCCRPLDSAATSITRNIVYLKNRPLSAVAKAFEEFCKDNF